jgi:hypothetical protein
MIPNSPNPASAAARTGSGNDVCFGGEQFPDSAPAQKYQARILVRRFPLRRDHLRLVPRPPPPPRQRRIEVRISAMDGRSPIGRTRVLRLTERDFERLIEAATRLFPLLDGERRRGLLVVLNDDERADLERARRLIEEVEMSKPADKEWREAYARGAAGSNAPLEREPRESPPLSLALIAHLAYLDRLIAGIRELDTAQSEQRIRRAVRVIERRRVNGLG